MPAHVPAIPLPRGWSRYLKSALLHAASLARTALLDVRAGFENSPLRHARQAAEIARLKSELARAREESRIVRARLEHVPPQKRPHYPPAERLAILWYRAAYGLSLVATARAFGVTANTLRGWVRRVDEQGERALVQTHEPVNRFPDFVAAIVQRLKATLPAMGKIRIAQTLARAGLHVAPSTARRLLARPVNTPPPLAPAPNDAAVEPPKDAALEAGTGKVKGASIVSAKYPHHLWHIDLTVVPTLAGLWVSFLPFALPQCWPWCWWVAAVLDHHSRAIVAKRAFRAQPSAADVCALLDSAVRAAGRPPRHIVSDQGPQFQSDYRAWCARHDAKPRFGAVGEHGSIAIIERFWLSMKEEWCRKTSVPLTPRAMQNALDLYVAWYVEARPHRSLGGRTPREVLDGAHPAHRFPRIEPRARYPVRGTCAAPRVPVRGRCGAKVELVVTYPEGAPHLPSIALRAAA